MKIFKNTHRWRLSLSNEALERIYYKKVPIEVKNQYIITNKLSLTRNTSFNENNSMPTIIIIRTNYKKKLLHVLTEGLSSYGFNIINLKFKIKPFPDYYESIKEETKHLMSKILIFFKQNGLIPNSNFVLLNYSKSVFSYSSILSNSKNIGFILINPILNTFNIKNFSEIINRSETNPEFFIVFSKKSNLIMNNKNLKRFLEEFPKRNKDNPRLLTLEKVRKSFKYYETILLGIIIDLIENNFLKSQ